MFLIMLAAGATYQNNLVFMMAFLCISLGLVVILQTARNLRDLEPLALYVESYFANESTRAVLSLTNKSADPKINLEILAEFSAEHNPATKLVCLFDVSSLEKLSTNSFNTDVMLPSGRGRYLLRRIRMSSTAPYGLFRAWIYKDLKTDFIVYPAAIGQRDLPQAQTALGDDFSGHKPYTPGDPMGRIDWKVYSRRKEYFIKQFQDGSNPRLNFFLKDAAVENPESHLSQLTLWINEAHTKQYDFSLETKSFNSGFGCDKAHLHRCLTELALWPV